MTNVKRTIKREKQRYGKLTEIQKNVVDDLKLPSDEVKRWGIRSVRDRKEVNELTPLVKEGLLKETKWADSWSYSLTEKGKETL